MAEQDANTNRLSLDERDIANAHIPAIAYPSEQEALELERTQSRPLAVVSAASRRDTNFVSKQWRRHVSMTLPHVTCRDHLGKDTQATSIGYKLDLPGIPRIYQHY